MATSSSSSPATASLAYTSSKAGGADDLLTADLGKNDYDWLLTPPGSPPAETIDQQNGGNVDDLLSSAALPNLVRSLAAIKTSRLAGSKSEPSNKKESSLFSTRMDPSLRSSWGTLTRSSSTTTTTGGGGSPFSASNGSINRRGSLPATGSSSSRPSSRPSTPTKKSPSPFISSSSSSSSSSSASSSAAASTVSRPTTPTNRSKPSPSPSSSLSSRPTTPTGRNNSRTDSCFRPSPSPSRPSSSASRPSTPVRRSSFSATPPPPSPSAAASRASSVTKGRPIPSRSMPASLNSSPTLKPAAAHHHHHAWEQLTAIPGFNLEPPPNLRTTNAPRSSSNSRGTTVGGGSAASRSASSVPISAKPLSSMAVGSLHDVYDNLTTRRSSPSPARTRSASSTSSTPLMTRSNSTRPERSTMDASAASTTRSLKLQDKQNVPSRRSISSASSAETLASSHMINVAVKPVSPTAAGRESSGHGRSLLRKPMEFSPWNKDIRAGTSATNGLHSLVSNVPASSLYSVRPSGVVRAQPDSFPAALGGGGGGGGGSGGGGINSAYGRNGIHDSGKELSGGGGGGGSINSAYGRNGSHDSGKELSSNSKAGEISNGIKTTVSQAGSRVDHTFSALIKDSHSNDWLGSPPVYRNEQHHSAAEQVSPQPLPPPPATIVASESKETTTPAASATCRHGSLASSCELCMMKLRLQRLTEKCRASLSASFQVSNNIFKGTSNNNAPAPAPVSSGHHHR